MTRDQPLPMDAFEWKLSPPQPGKDLSRMLGQERSAGEKADMIFTLKPPLKPLAVTTDTNLPVKIGAKGTMPVITENPDAKGNAVLFQDSFARYWVPYLGYHFNKVFYVWQHNWNTALLEQQKPDVVIDEMLERFLISENPATLKDDN
jgi:alginate O-acetyltransferase complex protein AlgJ